jgi:type IV pilus assembly protein PilE
MHKRARMKAFTLIELMITVVIIGILAGIAYPSYTKWVIQARRADAQRALMDLANRQERYYLNVSPPTYTADMTNLGYSAASNVTVEGGMYTMAVTAATVACPITSCYALTATAIGIQARDTACPTLTLTSLGIKTPTTCWK